MYSFLVDDDDDDRRKVLALALSISSRSLIHKPEIREFRKNEIYMYINDRSSNINNNNNFIFVQLN